MNKFARLALAGLFASLLVACGGGGGGAPGATTVTPQPAATVRATQLAAGLASPWSFAFLPDGQVLATERLGQMQLLAANGSRVGSVSGVPAVTGTSGQGGLLDVVLDPAYATNRRIYFAYSEADPVDANLNGTAVARAELDVGARALRNVQVIFRQLPKVASQMHFGSRLAFDTSGALFVTLGERSIASERGYAQDLTRGHGKVMRITVDGAAAPGNPAWAIAGAQPAIWSLGHRNPQGAAVHPVTGDLWISEHGPQGGDEINRVLAGRNYGWPLVSRGQEYGTVDPIGVASMAGMEDPLWVWETSGGTPWTGGAKSSIAPAAIAFYTAAAVPQWRGNLFVTALAGQALWRLVLDGNAVVSHERLLADLGQRMRDVKVGPDGALYLLTDAGQLLRYGP